MDKVILFLKYLLLGLVQGVAEVLPISSSGHLAICYWLFEIEENMALSILLHVASLIAVIAFLWKDLIQLIKNFFLFIFKKEKAEYKSDFMMCIYLVVSTLVLVVFTLIVKKVFNYESSPIFYIGCCLVLNAVMLFFLGNFNGYKKKEDMTWVDAVVVGAFECAGSFAGISRSGSCLCGCGIRKLDKETSAKYSFLLFIPAVLGGFVLEIKDIGALFESTIPVYCLIAGFIVSLVATYLSFAFLKKIINKGKLTGFAYYCFIVGALVAIVSGIQLILSR